MILGKQTMFEQGDERMEYLFEIQHDQERAGEDEMLQDRRQKPITHLFEGFDASLQA
jgi:hypothetical protein